MASGQLRFCAKAFATLADLRVDAEGLVRIPEQERRDCEASIARAADLLAVATRGRRLIVSATPPAALVPETDSDRTLLARAKRIDAEPPKSLSTVVPPLDIATAVPLLGDRWSGVAILAEALSHGSLGGKYRDLVRLFELAFTRSFVELGKKLAQTLRPAMGYSVGEIREWQALRHPFSHADGKVASEVALSDDARPVVQRMEQAAFDILFNKAEWSAWSSTRREAWTPTAITTSKDGSTVVRVGSNVTIQWLLVDEFGVFPRVVELSHVGLPSHWWHQFTEARADGPAEKPAD